MPAGRKPAHPSAKNAWKRHRPREIGQLAEHLGITAPAVSKWKQVPETRVHDVAEWLGVAPWVLRPDVIDPDPWETLKTKEN